MAKSKLHGRRAINWLFGLMCAASIIFQSAASGIRINAKVNINARPVDSTRFRVRYRSKKYVPDRNSVTVGIIRATNVAA